MGRYVTNQKREDAHTYEWLTVDDVCERAHIGKSYLYEQWSKGVGPRFSQVGKRRLVLDEWLTDWLMMREVA
jgi:hypothetical protein